MVKFFSQKDYTVIGIDNNMREIFFGTKGSTLNNLKRLETQNKNFSNFNIDIRNRVLIDELIKKTKPEYNCSHCSTTLS